MGATAVSMIKGFEVAEATDTRNPFSVHEATLNWVRDIAPYGILLTDADLIVRDWNQWLTIHSGLTAEQVVGRPLLELFPSVRERKLDACFERALRGEVTVLSTALHKYLLPFPSPVRTESREPMLQTARIAPLGHRDRIVGTVTIIEDVTQREAQASVLRRQQEYDRLLSDSLAMLIRAEEPLETITEIFPRIAAPLKLEVYFSYSYAADAGELHLQSAAGVAPEARRALATLPLGTGLCGAVAAQRSPIVITDVQSRTDANTEIARRLGLQIYCGFPLLIGDRLLGVLGFGSYAQRSISDDEIEFLNKLTQYVAITDDRAKRGRALREAQHRLSEHAGDLETKIAERTARLHETIVQLESFSYTVAHDLRAPIRSLNGYADILLQDFSSALPAEAVDIVERLGRAAHRLDALTRDLLKFSRIIRQEVTLAPLDLEELVAEAIGDNEPLRRAVRVTPPLGTVCAQRTLAQQCVSNLFDNAMKFVRAGQPPQIRVWSENRTQPAPERSGSAPMITATLPTEEAPSGPRLRLWIEDNGVGVPQEAHDKIWGIFERLPTASAVEGTGIGLAIVARAMQQMGGGCGLESEPGGGARFWLEFALP